MPDSPPPVWVLLRGLLRESGHWGAFVRTLQETLPPGSLILTPDLPGNGARWHERSPAHVAEMVQAVRADLAARGLDRPCHVLAMSLGAMVAVEWARQHPQELVRCVLINTSLRPYSPFWQRLRPRQYRRIARLIVSGTALEWEDGIMRMTTQHPGPRQALMAAWLSLRSSHPVSRLNGLRQLWAAARYRADAPPSVPLLLLNSAGDELVNPRCSEHLATAWGAPLTTHPTAGHDLPLDDGPWVAQQVARWLAPAADQAQGGASAASLAATLSCTEDERATSDTAVP